MREQRQVEKYTKMAADYAAVLGDPAETAPLLKAIGDKAEPELEAFMGRLSPLTNLAEVQKMLVEYGDASVDGSAVDQIAAYAVEIRKASPDLSVAEAKAQAWRDHPELKDAARQEGAV